MSQSQNETILRELQRRPITALDAIGLGILRLSARIYDLRNQGHVITSESRVTSGGARVAEYHWRGRA